MEFLKKSLATLRKNLGKEAVGLGFLALHVVQKIQTDMPNATSKEKRDAAVKELTDAALNAGMTAGENAIRFLIEGAVTAIKEKATPPAAPSEAPVPANKPKAKK